MKELRDIGKIILVSTHNLGSVPEFCDRTVLIKGTVLDYGLTKDIFNQKNLENTFGGVLRHFVLPESEGKHSLTILTDDERPFVSIDKNNKV